MIAAPLLLGCFGDPEPAAEAPPPRDPPPPRTAGAAREAKVPPPPAADGEPLANNVVVIVIDTLRADITRKVRTPTLDTLARQGDRAQRAWSSGSWTVPSTISLFTGMPVRMHGWDLPSARIGKYPPVPDAPTLASVLDGAGFRTDGLYSNPYLDEDLGFDRGFDQWQRTSDARMVEDFRTKVIPHWTPGGRSFAYLHLLGPHSPLRPTESNREHQGVEAHWFDEKRGLEIGRAKRNREEGVREAYALGYRAVVEDVDAIVGELLNELGPHRANTLVVVTSDHGELLGEHGIVGHGTHLWEPLLHVPLIVDRGVLPDHLTSAHIAPWVTSALGLDATWPYIPDEPALVAQREGLFAASNGQHKGLWLETESLRFHLDNDPSEESPHGIPLALLTARQRWQQAVPAGSTSMEGVELDPKVREQLEALGYSVKTPAP